MMIGWHLNGGLLFCLMDSADLGTACWNGGSRTVSYATMPHPCLTHHTRGSAPRRAEESPIIRVG